MTAVSDAGETFTVRRVGGTGGGAVTLNTAAGEPIAAMELPNLLGNHSRSVFENVFAFTLDELHDDSLLKDESINSQIYSAGMGATKLPGALKRLGEDKSRLFLKGGSKHVIHKAAGDLDNVNFRLRDVENNAQEYGRLSAKLQEIGVEFERLNGRRREHKSRLERQRCLQSAWDDWNELNTIEQKLSALPVIKDFPADGVSRLETLEERVEIAQAEYESARVDMTEAKAAARAQIEHETILTHSHAIRGLERGRTSFDNSVHDLPKRVTELQAHRATLVTNLKDLGPDWDEDRLKEFDLSIAVRQEISKFQERRRERRRGACPPRVNS